MHELVDVLPASDFAVFFLLVANFFVTDRKESKPKQTA